MGEAGSDVDSLCRNLLRDEECMGAMASLGSEVRCILDRDGVIRCLSSSWSGLSGKTRSEAVGRPLRDLLVRDDRHILQAFLNSAAKGREGRHETRVRLILAGDVSLWINVSIQAMGGQDSHVDAFGVVLADVDELVRLGDMVRSGRDRGAVAVEAAGRGLFELDVDRRVLLVNGDLLGGEGERPQTLDELLDNMHPDDSGQVHEILTSHLRDASRPMSTEFRYRDRGGTWAWRMLNGQVVDWDESGFPSRMTGIITDITSRKSAEQRLKQSEQRLKSILADSPVGVAVMDQNGDIQFCNQRFAEMRNLPPDMLKGQSLGSFYTRQDRFAEHLSSFGRDQCLSQTKVAWDMRGQNRRWVLMTWTPFAYMGRESILCWAYDITELVLAERKLKELATTDHLTSIFNRRFFMMLAKRELNRAKRYNLPLSLVMFDGDKFKAVNDTYGHEAGDRVLVRIARTGRRVLRDVDVLARIGGEEFAALLPETGGESALLAAERLRRAIEAQRVEHEGREIRFTVSLGVSSLDAEIDTVEELLNRADQALYKAKQEGRNRVVASDHMEEDGPEKETGTA